MKCQKKSGTNRPDEETRRSTPNDGSLQDLYQVVPQHDRERARRVTKDKKESTYHTRGRLRQAAG